MRFLALLLLSGCSTVSYDELLAQGIACGKSESTACDEVWEEINERDEARERREKRNASPCPRGYIHVINQRGTETCTTSGDLRDVFW